MAGPSKEQTLSLLAAANSHGDLAVKLSSLRQVKDILSSVDPSSAAEVFPYLVKLQSSPESLVRRLLIEVIEEIGLKAFNHSAVLMPVLVSLSKDSDHFVAHQSITSGMKLFCAVLEEIALQFHQQGKVERWAENIWHWMVRFKDVVYHSLFEPVPVGIKLLAVKFVETLMLLFTSDAGDVEKSTSGGKEHVFNMSLLIGGNPVLDPAVLTSEANRCMTALLDMLRSANNLPGPLAIAVVNCLAAVSRKRPRHYGTVLSAFLDLNKNLEGATGGHVASLQYSLRSAFLGFLRCTHPTISESKDRLLKTLRAMNAGDAADQVLRQVDKLMRNQERASRDFRVSKDIRPSNQEPLSGDIMRKRPVPQDDEVPMNGVERIHKRIHYSSNEQFPQTLQSNNAESDHVTSNGVSSKVPLLNSNLNPVEQMITVIAALLAEGERGANSLELLISQIHPDLLADIVITNMKHLPSAPPLVTKAQSQPIDMQNSPSFVAAQFMSSVSTSSSLQASATSVNATFPDPTSSTNLSDSKRDPRRDPRRLDPRRLTEPVEAPNLAPVKKEAVSMQSGFNALVAADVPLSPPLTSHRERTGNSTFNAPADEEIGGKPSIVCTSQVILKMEEVNDGQELPPFQDLSMSSDNSVSSVHEVVEKPEAHSLPYNPLEDTSDGESLKVEDDDYSPAVSDTPVLEETYQELPQVPLYIELSLEQEQILREVVVGRLIGSDKMLEVRDDCHTRMRLLARLVSQVDAHQHITSMLQKGIVLEYQRQQGHELVINMLYHLHARMISESSEESSAAAASVYEKLLLGVGKSLLDSLSASDKSFSRLLGEAPFLTDATLELLENVCCSEGSDLPVKENRDGDRVTQGLGAVWSLILGRPIHRKACLNIVLKCAVHRHDDIRSKAIRLAANKLYLLGYLSEDIERYATDTLLSAVDQATESRSSDGREVVNFEQSAPGSEQTEPLTSVDNAVNSALDVSQTDSTISFPEAQRLISLYFALCTKKPSLLQLVFNSYSRASKTVKQAVHRHIMTLTRAMGSSYSEILNIISDPPKGCEHLLMLVLQILTEQTSPSSELIATVKQLYETKLKDASILIPMLSSFSKNEVLPIFPRLVDLPIDKFQIALAHILQGSAHSGPALTPAEVLVAIHDINPEKGGIPLRTVTDACSACFEQRTVFTQQVLAKALNQMVDRTPLPLLFMRTVIQSIDAFPALVDFVMEILSKLVKRQIWKMPKLWVGFLKCVSQTQPHSFPVLLELPAPQLESALNKHANLPSSLATYASQPSVKASLPRSTLAVLGLSNEPRVVPPMHPSDTSSSVRGITPT